MSDVTFNCPHCKQSLEAPQDMSGQLIDCPACSNVLDVPYHKQTPVAPPPLRAGAPKRTSIKSWSLIAGVSALLLSVLLLVLYLSSDHRKFNKAVSLHRQRQFRECLDTLERVSQRNRRSSRFIYISSDCSLNLAKQDFVAGQYDVCLQRLATIPADFQKHAGVLDLESKCQSENTKRLLASRIREACSLFNNRKFVEAQALLDSLQPLENRSLSAAVQRLRASLQFCLKTEQQLPLHPIVKKGAVSIRNMSNVPVNRGLVSSLNLINVRRDKHSPPKYKQIHLHNPTQDKVKPDVRVLILNKDGVVILQHSESWLIDTLDFNQSRTVYVDEQFEFPASLAFSKWGVIGWDITPAYALCVGSKTSYDRLREQIVTELKQIRRTPPIITQYPYTLTDFVPEAVPFSFNTDISIANSTIVESLSFSSPTSRIRGVQISYWNRSDMRIKPNIEGYIFNKDGVIIASFQDSWSFFSLAPDERKQETKPLSFSIPDELVFSRWAHTTYDVEPAWFLLAGSSKQFHQLRKRTEGKIKQLNSISLSQE